MRVHGQPSSAVITAGMALLSLIWGSTYLVIREGLQDLPPFTSAAIRFTLASAVFGLAGPAVARREGGAPPTRRLALAQGVLIVAVPYAIVYRSETVLPSGLVSLLWASYPLMLAGVSRALLPGEVLTLRQWAGFTLGFLGVAVLFVFDLPHIGAGAVPAAAILLASPAVSSVGQSIVKRTGGQTSSVLLNRDGMLLGAAGLLVVAFVFERDATIRWTPRAVFSVAYLTVVGTVTAFGLYFWLLRHAPATRLSLIAYTIPLLALFLGALVEGEPLGPATALGAAGILGGVGLAKGPARKTQTTGKQ